MNQVTPLDNTRVLIVDDEAPVRRVFARALLKVGAVTEEASGGAEAIAALEKSQFDVVLTDIHMPDMDGLQVLRAVREKDLDASVVLVTGHPEVRTAIEALRLGALDYVVKPLDPAALRTLVARAAKIARLARLKREARQALGGTGLEAGDRIALDLALDRALETLWMAFQPIVRRDGTLYGYEALMRTREPSLPHPGAVLDAAERLDRLAHVGACTRRVTASHVEEAASDIAFFVNLHASDLEDPQFCKESMPLSPFASRTVLEITERASLDGVKDARGAVSSLKARGFRIAVDDLGAGYAGLTAFTSLEPDIAKLDMSLVRGVDGDPRKARVVGSMTSLCHDLGVLVVAEGVETISERDTLLELGCDLLQGYLLGKPAYPLMPPVWP